MITTKSVSVVTKSLLPNNAPRIGTDPIQGSWEIARRLSVCSRPAIEKLWPSRSSTVVRASRFVSDGTTNPLRVTANAKLSSLTDGARRRLMIPFSRTVGLNDNWTPKGWYWMVITHVPTVDVWHVG